MNKHEPRVGVVVVTRDRRDEVLHTLKQLYGLPEQPRVVLVDNGSTDGTTQAVAQQFPAVEVIDSGSNLGAAGRNLGVQRLNTPYVALCDDDTWWDPGHLSRAADRFDAHPELAVLTARVVIEPEGVEDPICAELEASPVPCQPGMPGPALLGFLAGASVVRRSAFLEAGGFEPRYFIGGEEELLALDLAAAGWWLCYDASLTVHHQPSQRRSVHGRRAQIVRNALWSAWLRRPMLSALRRTARLARGSPWDGVTLRGFLGALAGLPWVLRHRRVVPRPVAHALELLDQSAGRMNNRR